MKLIILLFSLSISFNADACAYQKFMKKNADFLFIGNSILQTRISLKVLNALAPDQTIDWTSDTGVYTDVWRIILKNCVATNGVHPKKVFLFFTNNNLTESKFKDQIANEKNYKRFFSYYAIAKDYEDKNNLDEKNIFLGWIKENIDLKTAFDNLLKKLALLPFTLQGHSQDELLVMVNSKYGLVGRKYDNPLPSEIEREEAEAWEFDKKFPQSPLKDILKDAKIKNLDLTFFRTEDIFTENDKHKKYYSDLQKKITESGFTYIDLDDHPILPKDTIADVAGHLKGEFLNIYTEKFYHLYMNKSPK